jgi:glycosyltransferase involved in cell wall biosynthesis
MTPAVGLVVPAYRPDVDRLAAYLREVRSALDPAEIRIEVDDPDPEIREALAGIPATVNAVPYRRGKGAAVTAGFEALETDVLAFTDADGSTPATSLASVVEPVADGDADLAVGSRRHPAATVTAHQTFARRFMGDAFAAIARRLLDVQLFDYQCGAKAIGADGWARIRKHLYEPGFAWDVELIAIAGAVDLRVREVPIEWNDQPGSTVSPVRDSLALARALVRARHRARQLQDDGLHVAIASHRPEPTALVDDE